MGRDSLAWDLAVREARWLPNDFTCILPFEEGIECYVKRRISKFDLDCLFLGSFIPQLGLEPCLLSLYKKEVSLKTLDFLLIVALLLVD